MDITKAKETAELITKNPAVTFTVVFLVVPLTLAAFNWHYSGIIEQYELRIKALQEQKAALETKTDGFKELITTENEIDFSNLKSN